MNLLPDDSMLAQFVIHSNHIEGIFAGPNDAHHHGQHLAAAMAVRNHRGELTHKILHQMIMKDLPGFYEAPGNYRTVKVSYGSRDMPVPIAIERLMQSWQYEVNKLSLAYRHKNGEMDKEVLAAECFRLHDHAECIHPYSDGNGRTFRLFLNQLRQSFGLPWILFTNAEWKERLAALQHYEIKEFVLENPWAYDTGT